MKTTGSLPHAYSAALVLSFLIPTLAARASNDSPTERFEQMHQLNARSQMIVVQESLNQVVIFRKERPADRTVIPVWEKPHEVEVSGDGETAYITNFGLLEADHKVGVAGSTISVIDVKRRRERTRFTLPDRARAPHGIKLRPRHPRELFTNTEEGVEEMVMFDTDNGTVLRTFPLPAGVHNFIFDSDGNDCYAFTTNDRVLRLDADNGRIIAEASVSRVRGLAWTNDRSSLIAGSRGELRLLNRKDLSTVRTMQDPSLGQIFYASASPNGDLVLAPAVLDGVVAVFDANTGQVRKRISTGSPLQIIFDAEAIWVSNVRVPAFMLKPGEPERPGGLIRISLRTGQTESIEGTEDANGIGLVW